jgi:lysozyme family protein
MRQLLEAVTMTTFDQAMAFVLTAEGAESNDPADPGGHTRFGISQRAHPDVNVATLTEADAVEIYRIRYWQSCGLDRLPPAIAVSVFDATVQHGARPAVRMLQHTLGVETDGVIGAVTLAAAYRADAADLITDYCARRGVYYGHLSTFGRYGYGWLRRIFRLAAYCRTVTA